MNEGWGENCTGTFNLESDSPIICTDEITGPESFLIDLIKEDAEQEKVDDFVEKFFPEGKPKFTVKTRSLDAKGCENYLYNDVFVGEKKIKEVFMNEKESGRKFESLLNY